MTDKERLEVIERQLNRAEIKRENLDIEDFQNILEQQLINGNLKWLVRYAKEQSERVQELETTVDFYQSALRDADRRVQELEGTVKHAMKAIDNTEAVRVKLINAEQQNKRYKQALEFYADEEHYKEKLISEAQYDADGICISNDEYVPPIIYLDSGEKARKALEESE